MNISAKVLLKKAKHQRMKTDVNTRHPSQPREIPFNFDMVETKN